MPRTKESGIDGIETDPNEIAPMALFGLVIKEQEVETLAKAYLAMREALADALPWIGVRENNRGHWCPPEVREAARAALERPE